MGKLIRFVIFVGLSPLLCAFCEEAGLELEQWLKKGPPVFAIGGMASYIILLVVILISKTSWWNNLEFVRILRHELAHAIVGALLGSEISRMEVLAPQDQTGIGGDPNTRGIVKYVRRPRLLDWVISLAPYCFPIFTIPFILVRILVTASYHKPIDFFIGFTLAFHYQSVIQEAFPWQSDIRKTGCFFSYGFIVLINLLFLISLKAIFNAEAAVLQDYLGHALQRTQAHYAATIPLLAERLKLLEGFWR